MKAVKKILHSTLQTTCYTTSVVAGYNPFLSFASCRFQRVQVFVRLAIRAANGIVFSVGQRAALTRDNIAFDALGIKATALPFTAIKICGTQ